MHIRVQESGWQMGSIYMLDATAMLKDLDGPHSEHMLCYYKENLATNSRVSNI